jgi:DNA-binding transcriptional regulator LsrR (DeoR family)
MPDESLEGLGKLLGEISGRGANGGLGQGGRPPRQDFVDDAERDQSVFTDYYVRNMRQVDIAAAYGLTQGRVSQILRSMRESGKVDFNLMRAQSMAVLADIRARQLEISTMNAAPVTAGKDGIVLIDPETGEVVRDYAGVLRALADAVKTDDVLAKRFGLDAPQKAEVAQTVRYEIAGLDVEDLG